MKADYEAKITGCMDEIAALETALRELEAEAVKQAGWSDGITQLNSGGELTAELINRLVERIEIAPDKTVTVICGEGVRGCA